jgi:DNA-binding SARP family transcriptional activator/tetratricopeptide (TPR) repeat protein
MEFRLLGEVQLRSDDQLSDVGTPRQQAVLAALAIDAGRPVPIETLVDRVWSDDPPTGARNVLYSHLSRIRQLLKPLGVRIDRRNAGYVLAVDPDTVDVHRFGRLVDSAAHATDVDRAEILTGALGMWRGTPLAGITGEWADQVRNTWHRRRLDAAVSWAEAEVAVGRVSRVIDRVPDLVAEYPLSEPLEAVLIRALHTAGRDAEALDRFAAVRARLADELGADPGPELSALHTTILRGEQPAPNSPLTTPAQLAPEVPGFVDREEHLRRLDSVVDSDYRVVTVSGTAGVGKTALVTHWAHEASGRFPDGQLYVNLRGFEPTGPPVTPPEAIRGMLDAFDVPAKRIPAGFDAQVGLYRSVLANRRVLVVLDNARNAEQVRPLLPGSPGCLALVTSRNALTGLVAAGAQPISLDLFEPSVARDLLAVRLGADRVATESTAVDGIVDSCARLPLALAVVAARAATHPGFTLTALARELSDARGSLDEFSSEDPATDPRAVFSWSYLQLSEDAARLFRLLGLHPGPDISTRAAASLAGVPLAKVRPLLAELARAHLIAEHAPGRFTFHDLLRAYAAEEAELIEYAADREAAVRRVLAHYVHSANHADRLLDPWRQEPPSLVDLPPGAVPEQPKNPIDWFDAERRVLLSALTQGAGFDAEVWQLTWMMRRYLSRQGHWHDELDALGVALAAARRLGDRAMQAYAQCFTACTYVWFENYDEARPRFEIAARLYREAGDLAGLADTEHNTAWMLDRQDRTDEALEHTERALELFRAAGRRAGQAKCLNAVGWFHAMRGDYSKAIVFCQEALDLQQEMGDTGSVTQTWHSLGYLYDQLGDYPQAVRSYQASLDVSRATGHRFGEGEALDALGDTHLHLGDLSAARAFWARAVDVFTQLGHAEAARVRTKLDDPDIRR